MRIKVQDGFEWGTSLQDIVVPEGLRNKLASGVDYIDSALGGEGFTPSAVTLFTGEAGAGKTTAMLTLADGLARRGATVVYNSGEESLYQLKMTAERLLLQGRFVAGNEVHVPTLLANCEKLRKANADKPFFLVVDSLQCMDDGHYADGAINSKSAERSLQLITEWANEHYTNPIAIGQVTKGGKFAGANTLRHMVDTYIHMSIERKDPDLAGCRIMETEKNRYGGAGARIFLGMTEAGFKTIAVSG
jgi:DNA repair protein RadA/Sms